ncbi:MAG: peptide-N-glycosidase F-related protein [Polyangiales bacterium]
MRRRPSTAAATASTRASCPTNTALVLLRGGWCPGLDVRPFIADLTADARVGEENELRYRASIGSAAPVATRDYGNINLSAYLVYSR